MKAFELFHGASAEHIRGIMHDGVMNPNRGEIFFVKLESELHTCFVHGADRFRGAAFAIKVRIVVPDNTALKPTSRSTNRDTWILDSPLPVRTEVLRLYVRHRPGEPVEVIEGHSRIAAYLVPKRFEVVIERKSSQSGSIVGELSVNGSKVCYTLELPWLDNRNDKSCVPPGKYPAFLRYDHNDRWRIELLGIPGHREHVQIHIGNYPRDIKGCVLVGTAYFPNAVSRSTEAYARLKKIYAHCGGPISVEFKGILSTPWGDYPNIRRTVT